MKNLIQNLIGSIENYDSSIVEIEGSKIMVTWNLFDFDLWHIMVDGNIIHSTKRKGIKKILKEWLDEKRYLENGILFKS